MDCDSHLDGIVCFQIIILPPQFGEPQQKFLPHAHAQRRAPPRPQGHHRGNVEPHQAEVQGDVRDVESEFRVLHLRVPLPPHNQKRRIPLFGHRRSAIQSLLMRRVCYSCCYCHCRCCCSWCCCCYYCCHLLLSLYCCSYILIVVVIAIVVITTTNANFTFPQHA
uniref:Uncharacterized protein n=1 Tax=Ascaris lumbricoides TaxID=6252 RepID=A0A0M3I626_ASCLU